MVMPLPEPATILPRQSGRAGQCRAGLCSGGGVRVWVSSSSAPAPAPPITLRAPPPEPRARRRRCRRRSARPAPPLLVTCEPNGPGGLHRAVCFLGFSGRRGLVAGRLLGGLTCSLPSPVPSRGARRGLRFSRRPGKRVSVGGSRMGPPCARSALRGIVWAGAARARACPSPTPPRPPAPG